MPEYNIEALIPHRGRMKLIDAILKVDSECAMTSATITDTWPLCTGNVINPVVLIEVVAQTAGILSSWKKGSNISAFERGLLTGIKSAEFFVDEIPLHTELITKVTAMYSLEDYEAMEGSVMAGTTLLGKVQVQIVGLKSNQTHSL